MEKNLLCLSWLNGQVKATAMQRGLAAGTWERPDSLPDFAALAPVMAEAVAKTRPEGRQVAMVLAHPRLSHQVFEVPPAKGRTLDRILERNVRNLPSAGEIAHGEGNCKDRAMPSRSSVREGTDLPGRGRASSSGGAWSSCDLYKLGHPQ